MKAKEDEQLLPKFNNNSSLKKLQNCRRVTLRSDYVEYCAKGSVSLIGGGGSGHEPYAAGYIGSGMLTAAISGNVFTSPPSRHVSAALNSTTTRGGSILFVINYTGDRLNFDLAAERYAAVGHHVRIVSIADDVAIEPSNSTVGRRGLAAAVLVIKIAGAMAESGKYTIDEIESFKNIHYETFRYYGSLYPCTLPGFGQTFEIPNDMMEIDFGIHGEPGFPRDPVRSAREIIDTMMAKLQTDIGFTRGTYQYVDAPSSQERRRQGASLCVADIHPVTPPVTILNEEECVTHP
ncbi:unnamed protein product [Angiostrongylus costaricensis]|uniref:DhaK domain-containing protein n=1 Tax=Angiostrongylus costaricensis TaxID=334426 RepID=A0A158PM31_ANGCS|nr:unnamed protein product [Angiostrongylus costaricensis]